MSMSLSKRGLMIWCRISGFKSELSSGEREQKILKSRMSKLCGLRSGSSSHMRQRNGVLFFLRLITALPIYPAESDSPADWPRGPLCEMDSRRVEQHSWGRQRVPAIISLLCAAWEAERAEIFCPDGPLRRLRFPRPRLQSKVICDRGILPLGQVCKRRSASCYQGPFHSGTVLEIRHDCMS